MEFKLVSETFEKISEITSRLEITQHLLQLFKKTNVKDISKLIYFCQGTIGARYKSRELNIGLSVLLKVVSEYSNKPLSKIQEDFNNLGDIGFVLEKNNEQKQKTLFSKTLSFDDVYNTLLKISELEGKGSTEQKINLFKSLLFNLDVVSAKHIIRFPISFRLGFGDSTIIDALSFIDESMNQKEAQQLISDKYLFVSDLGYIAEIIFKSGIKKINDLHITPFIPVKSALCERAKDLQEIIERLNVFAVDTKIDGFRLQIHKKNEDIKIFSRQEEDITHMFPEILTALKKINSDFIIDSEGISYDTLNKKYLPFQITMQRKRKYDIKSKSKDLPLHLKVFDVLYLDGEEVYKLPYQKRREILEKNFNLSSQIKTTNMKIIDNLEDLKDFFENSLNEGYEGIIAKDLTSVYKAGSRGFSWIKFKKSYGGLDTIDGCIIGGFYGKGRRTELGVGAFLIALYDEQQKKYFTVGKLGSGFSEEILEQLSKYLKEYFLSAKPNYLQSKIIPDFYVLPKVVVEINFDEITRSEQHTACDNDFEGQGLALRFPRFIKIREDLSPKQTTTLQEIKRLYFLQQK